MQSGTQDSPATTSAPGSSGSSALRRLWGWCEAHPDATLLALVWIALGPGAFGYFFDDAFGIVPWAQHTDAGTLARLWEGGAKYRFASIASAWLQAQLFGRWAMGYLLVGLAAYSLIVVIVRQCMRRCGAAPGTALAAAAIFALLPLHHVRWVFYVSKAVDGLWAVAAVWCFTHPEYPRRWWWGVAGSSSLVLGLFAYEHNLSIGAAIYAIAILMLLRRSSWSPWSLAARLVPPTLLTGAYAWLRFGHDRNLSFYSDVSGAPQTALAEGPAAFLLQYVRGLGVAALSHTHLLRLADYSILGWLTCAGPALAVWLVVGRRHVPHGRRVGLVLALWWAATLVPVADALGRVDAESHYLFYAGWPLVTALALYAPSPAASRRLAGVWLVLFAIVATASTAQVVRWLELSAYARTAVTSFRRFLPTPLHPERYYLLDTPGPRFGELPFGLIEQAVLLPLSQEERQTIVVTQMRDAPNDPPLRVAAEVPGRDAWPLRILRWRDGWKPEPLPAWVEPAPVGAAPLGVWRDDRPWPAQGWEPNVHLVPLQTRDGSHWYQTLSAFSLLTGPVLPAEAAPLAWARVTMAVHAERQETFADWLFITEADPVWNQQKVVRFRVTGDGQMRSYAVPIVSHPRSVIAGPVRRLALRPAGEPGAVVRIEEIRLVPLRAAGR